MTRPHDVVDHIYIHFPFCRSKCPYCDFYSAVDSGDSAGERRRAVAAATAEEWRRLRTADGLTARLPPRSVFIGGGDPSLAPVRAFDALLEALGLFPVAGDAPEFTVELNPEGATREVIAAWRERGANRFSLGVQTFRDEGLRALGRVHDADDARRALDRLLDLRARESVTLSIDLIYAVPGQTVRDWEKDLDAAVGAKPDHISAYALTYYEGLVLTAARRRRAILPVDEDGESDMFEIAHARLRSAGYDHYEISNYARPGHACRHNLGVWRGEDYVGLGPSAHSRVGARRWHNPPDADAWLAALPPSEEQGRPNTSLPRILDTPPDSDEERISERLLLTLRLKEGADLAAWPARERERFLGRHADTIQRLEDAGFATCDSRRLALSPRGWLRHDAIVRRLA